VTAAAVVGFDPATYGLHFPNTFPNVPLLNVRLPGYGDIPIGDAANGLCGGMAFAARDCFEARRPTPPVHDPPTSGPAFDYLVHRLIDSFDLPVGPARYYAWMSAADGDGPAGLGVASRTRGEVVRICAAIDRGELCVLGLIRTQSVDPRDLGKNHQVLAFGYALEETSDRLTLRMYDPNHPDGETTLDCSLTAGLPLDLQYGGGELTRGFFLTPYTRDDPAPLFGEGSRSSWVGSAARLFTRLFGRG